MGGSPQPQRICAATMWYRMIRKWSFWGGVLLFCASLPLLYRAAMNMPFRGRYGKIYDPWQAFVMAMVFACAGAECIRYAWNHRKDLDDDPCDQI